MDIFEQLDKACNLLVNNIITFNFKWTPDAPDELSWYLYVCVAGSYYGRKREYYFNKDDLRNAEADGDGFHIVNDDYNVYIEFCLPPVDIELPRV